MQTILIVHILVGLIALTCGFVALYAAKGATLHRKSGMLSAGAMLTWRSAAPLVRQGGAAR